MHAARSGPIAGPATDLDAIASVTFATLLKRHRLAAALSQEALAERAGLSARAVSDLERGVHRMPHPDTVRLLARALRLSGATSAELIHTANQGRLAQPDGPVNVTAGPAATTSRPAPGVGMLLVPVTRLIGRGRDAAALVETVTRADVRLVTLTGVGGVGKTRLAVQVARTIAGAEPMTVQCVGLASVREPELVLPAIAQALGVPIEGERSALDALAAWMHDRRVLLVLDNLEQVLGAAPLLTALLAASPGCTLMVTSRAALRVDGEHEYVVPPLEVPPAVATSELTPEMVTALVQVPAVQLFVDRATARRSTFELTAKSAPAVVEICRRLDGLPLALELAAARIGVLPAHEIAARLDDRFRLLTGGTQGAPPRQQTLRALLDWSYDLLSEPERRLLRRLSVFVGGWTLDAAEAIGGDKMSAQPIFPPRSGWIIGDGGEVDGSRFPITNYPSPITPVDTLDLLASLVDQSFVVAEPTHPGGPRYHLLETVRAYAAERLAECWSEYRADPAELQRRHAEHFRALAEEIEPQLIGPEQARWLRRLEPELPNILAALRWADEAGDWETGLRLAGSLRVFWLFANHLREGRDALGAALARAPADAPARLPALWAVGFLGFHLGERTPDGAPSAWEAGLALARRLQDDQATARFLAGVGSEAVVRGDFARAAGLLHDAHTRAEREHDDWLLQYATMWLGILHWVRGELGPARERFERALADSPTVADDRNTGNILIMLADVLLLQGDRAAARERAQASLHARGLALDAWAVGMTLTVLGRITVAAGDGERAARLFGAAEALRESIGTAFKLPLRWREDARCAVETLRARREPAAWARAWAEGRGLSLAEAAALAECAAQPQVEPTAASGDVGGDDRGGASSPANVLTTREREVAALIANGLTNGQIAAELVISERTVDTHAEHIRAKLDVRSRAEIAGWVARHLRRA